MFQKGVEIGSGVRPKIGRTRFPPLQFRDTRHKYDRLIFFSVHKTLDRSCRFLFSKKSFSSHCWEQIVRKYSVNGLP